jgi:hypothetical protein
MWDVMRSSVSLKESKKKAWSQQVVGGVQVQGEVSAWSGEEEGGDSEHTALLC